MPAMTAGSLSSAMSRSTISRDTRTSSYSAILALHPLLSSQRAPHLGRFPVHVHCPLVARVGNEMPQAATPHLTVAHRADLRPVGVLHAAHAAPPAHE